MKLAICIPSPASIHPEFALNNLPSIIAYSMNKMKGIELSIIYKNGVATHSNRNFMLKQCLKENIDGILWLDSDMLYPPSILEIFVRANVDVIGSVYCKRAEPYDPCVYYKGTNPLKPYKVIDVTKFQNNSPVEVDGLGFGGLFVWTHVYRAMTGKDQLGRPDMWMRYGDNFGIPEEMAEQESHDLVFCQNVKKYGFKLYVHPAIRAIHIGEKFIELKDWKRSVSVDPQNKKIAVLMPYINKEKADNAMKFMQLRAGKFADYYALEDFERNGFIHTINMAVHQFPDYDYYIYTAEDAMAGWYWLKHAFDTITEKGAGLLSFNDGKNYPERSLATFGMVEREWMLKNYKGDLFYSGYNSHFADVELTLHAINDAKHVYCPEARLFEADWNKYEKGVNVEDKKLFNKRKVLLFNSSLQELYE